MRKQAYPTPRIERSKVVVIMLLRITSFLIILAGSLLFTFSFIYNISFPVLQSQIHGAVFGVVIAFLGVRYYISVLKLKSEVYKTTSRFSWSNFKRNRKRKVSSKSRKFILSNNNMR